MGCCYFGWKWYIIEPTSIPKYLTVRSRKKKVFQELIPDVFNGFIVFPSKYRLRNVLQNFSKNGLAVKMDVFVTGSEFPLSHL